MLAADETQLRHPLRAASAKRRDRLPAQSHASHSSTPRPRQHTSNDQLTWGYKGWATLKGQTSPQMGSGLCATVLQLNVPLCRIPFPPSQGLFPRAPL